MEELIELQIAAQEKAYKRGLTAPLFKLGIVHQIQYYSKNQMKLSLKNKTTTMKNDKVVLHLDKDFVHGIIAQNTTLNIAEAIMNSGANLGIILKGCFNFEHQQAFAIGRNVKCSERVWDYSTQDSKEKGDTVQREVGEVTIVNFNRYTNQYEVAYDYFGKVKQEIRTLIVDADSLKPMLAL